MFLMLLIWRAVSLTLKTKLFLPERTSRASSTDSSVGLGFLEVCCSAHDLWPQQYPITRVKPPCGRLLSAAFGGRGGVLFRQAEPAELGVEELLQALSGSGLVGVTRIILKTVGEHELHVGDELTCRHQVGEVVVKDLMRRNICIFCSSSTGQDLQNTPDQVCSINWACRKTATLLWPPEGLISGTLVKLGQILPPWCQTSGGLWSNLVYLHLCSFQTRLLLDDLRNWTSATFRTWTGSSSLPPPHHHHQEFKGVSLT